ncbi:unnamed protein product [Penicillium salamii]|uniref:Alpha/beta hydrolase fold-3 domain-containing protein n=1 Tax=Penicillium salamii TaxID=1612424 RepID=A0A9W4IVA5_9EURO|nr:unnamed protein product [Penicillium salamii]
MENLDISEVVRNTHTFGLHTYNRVTAHPDEVLQIPSREPGRPIRIHAYNTLNRGDQPTPVLINFHGSGFVIPLHGTDDEYAQAIVDKTDYVVLDCSYRLAPENPWPAAVHDAEDVVKWVLSQPSKFSPSQISISGFSAGGSLALIMSGVVFPSKTFRNVASIYPATDLAQSSAAKIDPKADPSLNDLPTELIDVFLSCYVPDTKERKNPLVSASFIPVENFSGRFLLVTGAGDALCLEAEALGRKIKEQTDAHVEVIRYDGCEHAFDKLYKEESVQEAAKDDLNAKVAEFIRQ